MFLFGLVLVVRPFVNFGPWNRRHREEWHQRQKRKSRTKCPSAATCDEQPKDPFGRYYHLARDHSWLLQVETGNTCTGSLGRPRSHDTCKSGRIKLVVVVVAAAAAAAAVANRKVFLSCPMVLSDAGV
jgi:hypothetical protein